MSAIIILILVNCIWGTSYGMYFIMLAIGNFLGTVHKPIKLIEPKIERIKTRILWIVCIFLIIVSFLIWISYANISLIPLALTYFCWIRLSGIRSAVYCLIIEKYFPTKKEVENSTENLN